MERTTRNASLDDLATMLKEQQTRKVDVIVPASKLTSERAQLVVSGAEPLIEDDGVTDVDGTYTPTVVCDEQIAEKLSIPVGYLKRMRAERPDLYDANVNGWLHGVLDPEQQRMIDRDPRKFMLRTFKGDDDGPGIARALLSDRYNIVDNLDVLMATLAGVRDAGVSAIVQSCDLTDRRMYARIVAPEVQALAPTLLKGYRSPFDQGGRRAGAAGNVLGAPGHEYREDVVFAGFEVSNSETGGGAFTITPRIVVMICDNGLTITKDALRSVHVGGKLDEGVINWSAETQRKSLELVTAQTRDAVSTFLDVEYMTSVIERIEADAATPIERPDDTIKAIGKTLRYSEAEVDGILDHFIRGGQMTAGGVLNAVTSYAQCIDDADDAHELEASALRAFDLAAV